MPEQNSPPPDDAGAAHTLRRLRELKQKIRDSFDDGRDRTAAAEHVIDEMARRQGLKLAPLFDWTLATPQFETRLDQRLTQKPGEQSMQEFVRAFVDAWPRGEPVIRIEPDAADPVSNPPYSKDGLWPANLEVPE